jgi:hypothetical protein
MAHALRIDVVEGLCLRPFVLAWALPLVSVESDHRSSPKENTMSRTFAAATLIAGGLLILGLAAPSAAQTTSKDTSAKSEAASAVKVPETAQEHLAVADTYRQKAATFRSDAASHRQMLDAYKKQVAVPTDHKAAVENPWVKKMRSHCESYIRAAESMASEAETLSEFHRLRAHEAQGK